MKNDLVGVWSADALFAPGSQEDEIIVFRSDETGWIEWMNFGAHEIEFFYWMPTSSGWVVFSSEGRFELNPHNRKIYIAVEHTLEDAESHLPFVITQVQTPLHGLILQLELELPGWHAGLYGLIGEDADSWPRPETPI